MVVAVDVGIVVVGVVESEFQSSAFVSRFLSAVALDGGFDNAIGPGASRVPQIDRGAGLFSARKCRSIWCTCCQRGYSLAHMLPQIWNFLALI